MKQSDGKRFPYLKTSFLSQRKTFIVFFGIIIFSLLTLIVLQIYIEESLDLSISYQSLSRTNHSVPLKDVNIPVILWWTPFTGEFASFRKCGKVECFLTEDRNFIHHPLLKAILFYGSKFDVLDLPLPRNATFIIWALFHEESPKNTPVLLHEHVLNLFNFTATFSRWSNFPLTLQYLEDIEDLTSMLCYFVIQHRFLKNVQAFYFQIFLILLYYNFKINFISIGHKYLVQLKEKNKLLEEIAPILYIQSDCNTPLERDAYVIELKKYISVDSYGACLQNQILPKGLEDPMTSLDSEDFFHFVAKYKFTLAFENAVCDDYITEKLWRPLSVGSIPLYLGSPIVHDWLPNLKSAIIASDFDSPKSLAEYVHKVNGDDELYESFLEHKLNDVDKRISNDNLITAMKKRSWGIGNDLEKGNMVEHFECFVCLNSVIQEKQEFHLGKFVANVSHYNCPLPISPLTRRKNESNWWLDQWKSGHCEGEVLKKFIKENKKGYTNEEFYKELKNLFLKNQC